MDWQGRRIMAIYTTEKQLLSRGWSLKGIQLYLGKHVKLLGNEKLYDPKRVKASEEFLIKQGHPTLKGIT